MSHPPVYTLAPVLTALDYSPDGKLLAISGYHEVLLHAADGSGIQARLVGLAERIESALFSPDGKSLAVTGGSPGRFGEVQVWDVEAKEFSLRLSHSVTYDTIYGASWSPDGKLVAFGCGDNTLRVIEAASGKQVVFQGAHSDWVLNTAFSTTGSHVISVSRDRSMKLTEVATQRFEDNITSITPGALKGGLMAIDRHPTREEVAVGGADGVPKLFRIYREKGKERKIGDDFNLIRNYDTMPGRLFDVQFSRDGGRIVCGSSKDNTGEVRVYQTDDAKLVSKLAVPQGGVYAVAFNPAGTQVASAGFDGLIRLSDPASGQLIKEFPAVPLSPAVAAK
jgi:WD40 repeat protein